MNMSHLRAFIWLRWRLLANQVTKGTTLNKILLVIFGISTILGSIGIFIGAFTVGVLAFALADIPSWVMLVVWDGLIVLFLFAWAIGLLSELQRSEALSVEKFLHLPVSLAGVFVLNYLSSLLSINLLLFVPLLVGFSLGLVISKGLMMLLILPMLAAFFLMVTALTYQFQGWLASLMVNKRRRRAIIAMVTFGFILLFQLPNVLNLYFKPLSFDNHDEQNKQMMELNLALANKDLTVEEHQQKVQQVQRDHVQRNQERGENIFKYARQTAEIASLVLPPGWLAIGAWGASEGSALPALMGAFGMGLIGVASLWRGYRTSLRLYTGQFTKGQKTSPPAIAPPPLVASTPGQPRPATLLEWRISWLSEPAAVIALAAFRSLTRAPEAKMLLLSPLIMMLVFGGIFSHGSLDVPAVLRPLIVYGVMTMILFTMVQLVSNQFGYDRSGFKIYVLSPVSRRDILLGKNLAILPLVVALTTPMILLIEFMVPLPIGYLLAVPFEFVSMFLLLCMVANMVSILAPMPVASGTLKPVSPKMIPMLMHVVVMLASPLVLTPILLPWGIEAGLAALELVEGIPICLVLSALECAAIILLYRWLLGLQGRLLQYRELTILETVTTKAE